jgi:hypothetical protein
VIIQIAGIAQRQTIKHSLPVLPQLLLDEPFGLPYPTILLHATTNRRLEHRIWYLLWYFLIDIAAVNAFICWRWQRPRGQRRHCAFRQELVEAFLNYPLECEAVGVVPDDVDRYPGHSWTRFSKQGRCEWCRYCPKDNMAKRTNQAAQPQRIRPSTTYGGCETCNTTLCASGSCFRKYHDYIAKKK